MRLLSVAGSTCDRNARAVTGLLAGQGNDSGTRRNRWSGAIHSDRFRHIRFSHPDATDGARWPRASPAAAELKDGDR
jgi:hypothetical protein